MKARKDPIKSGFDWDMVVVYIKIPDRIQHNLYSRMFPLLWIFLNKFCKVHCTTQKILLEIAKMKKGVREKKHLRL
jgi:hypothetical protein